MCVRHNKIQAHILSWIQQTTAIVIKTKARVCLHFGGLKLDLVLCCPPCQTKTHTTARHLNSNVVYLCFFSFLFFTLTATIQSHFLSLSRLTHKQHAHTRVHFSPLHFNPSRHLSSPTKDRMGAYFYRIGFFVLLNK